MLPDEEAEMEVTFAFFISGKTFVRRSGVS